MYATIFTYFSSPQTADAVSQVAVQLAAKHGAHLIGAHNSSAISLYGGLPADVLSQHNAGQRKEAEAIEATFTAAAKARNISHEWRHRSVKDTQLVDDIIQQGRAADLIITCVNDDDDQQPGFQNAAVRLAMESGRPVLFVPPKGAPRPVGNRIAVAWSASRESTRAVHDALPLLKAASAVSVISVKTSDGGDAEPGKAIVAALARHGVKAETAIAKATDRTEGAELLAAVEQRDCDLLVMGVYSHSKWRQMVLGGVTSYVLSHLTVPLLVSH